MLSFSVVIEVIVGNSAKLDSDERLILTNYAFVFALNK